MARNDIHRPAVLAPEDYKLRLSYSFPSTFGGAPVPGMGINCVTELSRESVDENGKKVIIPGEHAEDGRCCIVGYANSDAKFAEHGGSNNCTLCGSFFLHGDIWEHMPSGEHIYLGHICAEKYSFIAERREYEKAMDGLRVRSVREHEKAMKQEAREAYIDRVENLRAALEVDHKITRSIKESFFSSKYTRLTERQEALVLNLYRESLRPKRKEEPTVPAVIEDGRQVVEGEVVSVRYKDSFYGGTFKLTVKVPGDGGVWLAWGTCPTSLLEASGKRAGNGEAASYLRGAKVRFSAKLKRGRDAHFAVFSRPTKASVIEWAEEDAAEAA